MREAPYGLKPTRLRCKFVPSETTSGGSGDEMPLTLGECLECMLKASMARIGGKTVEVCCEECARKLKEAHSSSREG
jgi:hypothetical protein